MKKGGLSTAMGSRVPELQCQIAPTSFDPTDPDLGVFPRSPDWRWTSCERILRQYRARTVLLRLPLFWQVEIPLYDICRSVGATIYVNEKDNMTVGLVAIQTADANTVITDAEDAGRFCAFLTERNTTLPLWFVIHQASASTWELPSLLSVLDSVVAQEVHLFPGVPILYQCADLVQKRGSLFHCSDDYRWETTPTSMLLSDAKGKPIFLDRYLLPFILQKRGSLCTCGNEIVERKQ